MFGRPRDLRRHADLRVLALAQRSVLRRDQLAELGIGPDVVAGHVAALRWSALGPSVVALDNGYLDVAQTRWAAVLCAGPRAALCAWTALEVLGLRGFERSEVHVVVPRGERPTGLGRSPGVRVVVHESRRHLPTDVVGRPPRHRAARAAMDAAAWAPTHRAAAGVLVATVQQRLATPGEILLEMERVPRLRRGRLVRSVLWDVEGGVRALSELDFAVLCREAGLPEPERQRTRRDSDGRLRYLDVEWRRRDGRRVVVEVDGRGHMRQDTWEADLLRANDVVIGDDAIVLRVPSTVLRTERAVVVRQLRRALAA